MTNNVDLISKEEKERLLRDKNWFFVKSYKLSQALAFLTNQKPLMAENTGKDKDINRRIYFYERTQRFNESLKILLDTKQRFNKEDLEKVNLENNLSENN